MFAYDDLSEGCKALRDVAVAAQKGSLPAKKFEAPKFEAPKFEAPKFEAPELPKFELPF